MPKGPISNRAIKADFNGERDLKYEPLPGLKEAIRELRERNVAWWTLPSETLLDQVHYSITTSADEWANEILGLDQLIVEGFKESWLRKKTQELGRKPDSIYENYYRSL